jgi:hypothetical protein
MPPENMLPHSLVPQNLIRGATVLACVEDIQAHLDVIHMATRQRGGPKAESLLILLAAIQDALSNARSLAVKLDHTSE